MLTKDDALLDLIARQARIAYAEHQLDRCRKSLQALQGSGAAVTDIGGPSASEHIREEYIEEVVRWQDYLMILNASNS